MHERILHLSGRGDLSGGPLVMANLINELSQFQHGAVFPFVSLQNQLDQTTHCQCFDLNLHTLHIKNIWQLQRIQAEFRPDLIHSHGKAAGLWGRLLARLLDIPIIHQFHGMHWRHYPFFLQGSYFAYERVFARWTNGFVFVSYGEQDEYDQWIDENVSCMVIHNGINSGEILQEAQKKLLMQRLQIPERVPVLASITRAVYQKSLDRLLQIHHDLLLKRPAVLLLFGVRPDELRKFKLSPGQETMIRCVHDEQNIPLKLQLADIYISTSRWEGFSLGLLEALGVGVPAVVSAVTGHLDLLSLHPRGIRLVGTHQTREYLNHIEEWLSDPTARQQAGQFAKKRINEQFSLADSAAQMEIFYRSVLNNEPTRPFQSGRLFNYPN